LDSVHTPPFFTTSCFFTKKTFSFFRT
jgi:hypothetical protein